MGTEDRLGRVRQEVVGCTRCGLCEGRTNAVPGKGSGSADVIFVGEAPGRNEDKRGEPFVGVAGRILEEALDNAGVSRDDVYITNVVKCRPPGNRVPASSERESCMQYLQEEIDAIGPKVICVLGNTAFGSLLGGSEITKFRGRLLRRDGRLYFLTVHPAAPIYNRDLGEVLKGDIVRLFGIVADLKGGREVAADVGGPS